MATDNKEQLRAAATGHEIAKKEPQSFPSLIEKMKPQLALALPKHLTADRMVRIAMTCYRNTPKLDKCDPMSVMAGVVMSAQLGLELGVLGQSYLVPYRDRRNTRYEYSCNFIPGWRGMCDLVNRSGRASIWTGAVFKGDEFEYEFGSAPFIHHKPGDHDGDPANLEYTYSVGAVKGSEHKNIDVWSVKKVWRHRDRYNKVGDSHYSFGNPEMYARKVVFNQVVKYMPVSVEFQIAQSLSFAADKGPQDLTLKEAIEGSFNIVPDEADNAGGSAGAAGNDNGGNKGADADSAIASIKAAKNKQELSDAWSAVTKLYADAGQEIPALVNAAHGDRQDFLR